MSELFPTYRASWETEAHRDLRKHAAEFFRKASTPNQERWAAQHAVDREYWNQLGDAGLLGLDLPEEYGGTGGDFGLSAVVGEEMALALIRPAAGRFTLRSSPTTSTPTAMTNRSSGGCPASSAARRCWRSP